MLAPQSAGIENLTFYFPSGQLKVIVQKSNYLFSHLTAVAERYNLKRPFLFVSKVLGKHYPVRPSRVLDVHQKLAALMPPLLPPVVFIAMAETAVGLGRGVFESYTAQTKVTEALFTQTTRYALSHPLAFTIDEPHCHAPKHLVYQPVLESSRKIFNEAQSLVLIDDEITSGRTLSNLTLAYKALNPKCSQVHLVSITDWSDNSLLKKIARESNLKAASSSLLKGRLAFYPSDNTPTDSAWPIFKSVGDFKLKDNFLTQNYGRLGLTSDTSKEASLKARKIALGLSLKSGPVRVVGTGEFLHEPLIIASTLEERGFDVLFQSTTRTPAALGPVLKTQKRFKDNYHESIDNFLYNPPDGQKENVIIVYETNTLPEDHNLPGLLGASEVIFL